MTVNKLFWNDPYLTQVDAKITNIEGDKITLDRTIAFAFSGGQQSDSGTIGGFDILCAEKIDKEIYYTIEPDHGLSAGENVTVSIDWVKRYRLMRLHFAAELILELVYQHLNRPEKIGANITDQKARLDFYYAGNISEAFPFLDQEFKKLIDADANIVSEFSDEENEKRFWSIEGFAKVPCGGTHPKKTGEVGAIALKRHNIGGGKERIEITLKS